MQKKLIVLALASAFAAPAFAASSNVDVYGQLDVAVDRVSGIGDGLPGDSNSAWRLSSNASRIGLKGSEDLGSGLAAIWQFEQTINLDAGTGGANGNAIGSMRNTFLGMKGGFGTVLAGTHDTPYKLSTASLDPFADTMGDYNAIIGSFQGLNTSDLRLGNVLAYISPSFNGLTAAVATSFLKENGKSNASGKPTAWTGMVNYANGPLYVGLGYETAKHLDLVESTFTGGTTVGLTAQDVRSWKLGAGYSFGDLTVNAIYDNIKVKALGVTTSGSGTTSLKRAAWGLNAVYNMGNIALKAGYYHANKVSNTSNTGANMYEIGGDYNLSKRTKLYALYTKVNNDTNASYCAGGALNAGLGASGVNQACGGLQGSTSTNTLINGTSGKDPSAFAIGMRHTF